jgi:NodT family efflux transporter outer membrane factor (OMF) lipoprotein
MRLDHPSAGMRVHLTHSALLVIAALGLSACASMSGIEAQAVLRDAPSLGLPAEPGTPVSLEAQWWREFGDEQLDQLIDEALATSPSLRIVQARMARAQAGADVADAAAGPQLTAAVDATRQLYTANAMIPKPYGGSILESGTAQLTGSWELDFFGKNRAALNAALGNTRAAQADAEAARMLLASNVARSYFSLARLNDQLGVARQLLAQRTQSLRLVQDRVNAGLDTRLEQRQSEGALPDARLQIETLQEQLTLARHALNALLGQPNKALALDLPSLRAIKNIAEPTTLPSDLLGRRADVAAARWRVEAATQDVSNARSQFYPNINLMAFAGFSSIGLDRLMETGSQQWGVGPALRLPLFDGGRLRANLRGKTADLDVAIESYNAAVIDAVRDVADQLTSRQAIVRQLTEQRAALALAENAYDIAVRRYDAGLVNFLSVLNAETTVLALRRQGVDLVARALDTQVALMRALGGGYVPLLPPRLPTVSSNPSAS